ncbi:MAG TPA: CPBP family intramembrane glutamic endopeptidase [Bacteroidales bacterium]|nr:CPBP family intramembrane glutamic endopeptidase [Bacteroidales bacterium]
MNHLELAFTGKNNFWRYLVMIAAVFIASNTVGAIPLLIFGALTLADNPDAINKLAENPSDMSALTQDPYSGLLSLLFPFIAGLIAFIILVKPINNRSFRMTVTGSPRIRWNHYFVSFVVWTFLSFLYLVMYMRVDPSNFFLNNASITLLYIAFMAVALIPFQAAFEEVLFRGYLMQGFATIVGNRWFPLIMTSVLFGLLHGINPEVKEYGFFTMMPQYILFGLIFGVATLLDDGAEIAMGAHAANNIFLVIMVTQKSSALPTPALYEQLNINPWTEFTGLLLTGLVFILIMKVIFKWPKFSVLLTRIS